MKLNLMRIVFLASLIMVADVGNARTVSSSVFLRNAGIVASGLFSAFDVLNRILLFTDLGAQKNACADARCQNNTRTQEVLNAVGLGFSVLPPIGVLATGAVYALYNAKCGYPFSTDERGIQRVTFVSASMAVIGSSVALGTAAKGLAISEDLTANSPSSTRPPDSGRWIASTILSGASEIASVVSVTAATCLALN